MLAQDAASWVDDFTFEFALALVIARGLEDWRSFRLLPPGLWLYLLHCALCFVSIINAPNPNFVCMAALKAVKIAIIFLAGYNFFTSERNIQVFLVVMAFYAVISPQLRRLFNADGWRQAPLLAGEAEAIALSGR